MVNTRDYQEDGFRRKELGAKFFYTNFPKQNKQIVVQFTILQSKCFLTVGKGKGRVKKGHRKAIKEKKP